MQAGAVAAEGAVAADDAVAGDDDRQRVRRHHATDGAGGPELERALPDIVGPWGSVAL